MIRIIVPGTIIPWKRPQRRRLADGSTVTFTDRAVESYHGFVRLVARDVMAGRPPIEEAIILSVLAVFEVPTSWSGKRQRESLAGLRHKTTRPDLDNTKKGCLDALKSIVYKDDAQIVGYRYCAKIYGKVPRLEIGVQPVPIGIPLPLLLDRSSEILVSTIPPAATKSTLELFLELLR